LGFNQLNGSAHTDTFLVPNPTFKLGLTNNVDVEINTPAGIGVHSFDAATGASTTIWGVNDVFLRTKINLWGNDGGASAFALIPFVKLPTAPTGIGNGAVEEGVIAPLSVSLPKGFTVLFNSEIDLLKKTSPIADATPTSSTSSRSATSLSRTSRSMWKAGPTTTTIPCRRPRNIASTLLWLGWFAGICSSMPE
jgi:hypothetical protein